MRWRDARYLAWSVCASGCASLLGIDGDYILDAAPPTDAGADTTTVLPPPSTRADTGPADVIAPPPPVIDAASPRDTSAPAPDCTPGVYQGTLEGMVGTVPGLRGEVRIVLGEQESDGRLPIVANGSTLWAAPLGSTPRLDSGLEGYLDCATRILDVSLANPTYSLPLPPPLPATGGATGEYQAEVLSGTFQADGTQGTGWEGTWSAPLVR